MKTTRAAVPSVVANGTEIKKHRLAAKQTQKELIRGSSVQLRTYQRAEEGKSISRETLAEIARLLKVTFEAFVQDEVEKEGGQVRLYNCGGKGGSQIMKLLQGSPGSVRYRFDLDPGPQEAEKIAAVVELCKSHTVEHSGPIPGVKRRDEIVQRLDETSADYIRAVGQLNSKLRDVTAAGVNVFVGSYWYWGVALEVIEPDVEDEEYIQRPDMLQRVLITFSERNDEFVLEGGPGKYELEEASCERAARWNYKHKHPPGVVHARLDAYYNFMEFGEEFLTINRDFWNKQKALERSSEQKKADRKVVSLQKCGGNRS